MRGFSLSLNRKTNNRNRHRRSGLPGFLLLLLLCQTAEARLYILVDEPSEKRFPIAIVDLLPETGRKSKDWSIEFAQKIRSDLELTNLFDLIDATDFPTQPEAFSPNPATIQFPPWSLIGAQALVIGSYSLGDGKVKISLHLYDPLIGQHLFSQNYEAKEDEISVVAHHFADEIMRVLTGERGVFSTQIAFVCLSGKKKEICTMDMDGGRPRQLTKDRSINLSPVWSPNGKQIAFSSYKKGGDAEIFTVSSGGESVQITSNGAINISPTWTPGGQLTLASAMGGDVELYLASPRGKILRRLTKSFGIDVNPCWSPDGNSVVFASERAGRLHLFRANAEGGAVQRLTFVGYHNDNPAWSPRGDKIVFQGMDMGNWDLFIMNADGSMVQRLTVDSGNNESPSWAPNGRFITFSSSRNGPSQIFIMRDDGSHQTHVGPKSGALQPSWSPWFD